MTLAMSYCDMACQKLTLGMSEDDIGMPNVASIQVFTLFFHSVRICLLSTFGMPEVTCGMPEMTLWLSEDDIGCQKVDARNGFPACQKWHSVISGMAIF